MTIPKPCLSVCLSICLHPEKRYHHSFVNISPTLVIDTSMERCSRVLHHGNPKIWIFFQKSSKFVFWRRAEITLASSIQSYISNWYINGKVFTSTTPWKPKNLIFFFFQKSLKFEFCLLTKSWNHLSFVNISPTLVIDTSMERSSQVLRHGIPKIWFFFQKSLKFKFWLLTKSWNHLSFVNISPTLVIDTSMERSLLVVHRGNPKIWFFLSKKFKIRILTFDEELKSP